MPESAPPSFLDAYRRGDLGDFFALGPADLDAALTLPRPLDRRALAAALEAQADGLGAPDAARRQLRRLAHPDARAVVAGQQVGLLLGPTYTLSKAVTAVKLAARLDTPERPVVPVFWLATQDHDAAEIDHAWLLDLDERLARVTLPLPAGVAAGRLPLPADAAARVVAQLAELDVRGVYLEEVRGLLEATAGRAAAAPGAPGGGFGSWFGALLYALLGPAGLIVADPLDPALARLAAPLLARELRDPAASVHTVQRAGERLDALGFAPQLGRADDATNLFVELPGDGPDGLPRRELLRRAGDRPEGPFVAADRRFERDELLERLERDPTCITPAAGLRPVMQDTLLPTAVTVVGPGELRYIAQLAGVYGHHGVAQPLIWPRATATVLEPPVRRILARHALDATAFLADPQGCEARVLLERAGHAERFRAAHAHLARDCEAMLDEVAGVDPTLQRTVTRQRQHIARALDTLERKTARALAQHDAITRRQFQRLAVQLLPGGTPQERKLSPFSFFLKFGVEAVVEAFLTLQPEGEQFLEL